MRNFVPICRQAWTDWLPRPLVCLAGVLVLGSIHTEMMALLEDRASPLYSRMTDTIELTHLDIGLLLAILQDHAPQADAVRAQADSSAERLLFFGSVFEGAAKFYRDCFEHACASRRPQDLAAAHLLRKIVAAALRRPIIGF